jgi:hypothetical protein
MYLLAVNDSACQGARWDYVLAAIGHAVSLDQITMTVPERCWLMSTEYRHVQCSRQWPWETATVCVDGGMIVDAIGPCITVACACQAKWVTHPGWPLKSLARPNALCT